MYKVSTSVYAYQGDTSVTLNALTGTTPVTTKTLADLSTDNYPSSPVNNSPPNAENQAILMNQPMSWWVQNLNAPVQSVKYLPVSNYVNWGYTSGSNVYHVGMPISNSLIPNGIATSVRDSNTNTVVNTYTMKYGMSRVDTMVSAFPNPPVGPTGPASNA